MCNVRKAMAILLVLVMSLSFAFCAIAETSSPATATTDVHVVDAANGTDTVFQTGGVTVGYEVSNNTSTVVAVASTDAGTNAVIGSAQNADGTAAQITQIGDGKAGVLEGPNGQNVTTLTIYSDQKVTIAQKAFKGSDVKTVVLYPEVIAVKANAFKGSDAKKVVVTATNVATCDNLQLNKKAFNGLKKITIKVSKSKMPNKEYKKLKKKMKKKYGKKFGKTIVLKRVA